MRLRTLVLREIFERKSQLLTSFLAILLGITVIVSIKNITFYSEKAVALEMDFAAQQNCMPSAQINCHTTWKEEEGFLLPSRLLCTKSEFPYLIAKRCNAILANSESLSGLAQRPTLAQCSSGRLCGPSVRRGPNEFQRLWSA